MSDGQTVYKADRHRVNIKETANGICQVDCTAECEAPADAVSGAVSLLAATREQLRAAGRQVTE